MDLLYSEASAAPEKLFKVIIIGDPTVGKTSFVQRYVQNLYRKDYKGTVGVDFALKVVKWSETQTVKLQLWDIAGKRSTLRTQAVTTVERVDFHVLCGC
jgi:Ras-related protein Rab-7L1